jgi:Uma2 family endonuclease
MVSTQKRIEQSMQIPDQPVWRLRVDQYQAMIQAGIFTEDDPIELLEGLLVTKMPKNRRHSLVTGRARDTLAALLPAGWYIDAQEPITLADSQPEPDLSIIRGTREDYAVEHPGPGAVTLVIEVSDSTLERDRTLKLRLYARAKIAVYWIINLVDERIEVYSTPTTEGDLARYTQVTYFAADALVPLTIDGQAVATIAASALLR